MRIPILLSIMCLKLACYAEYVVDPIVHSATIWKIGGGQYVIRIQHVPDRFDENNLSTHDFVCSNLRHYQECPCTLDKHECCDR